MKYKAILLRKIGDKTYEKMKKEIKFNPEKDVVLSYKEKTFPLTESMYFYRAKKTAYIFLDFENEKILTFHAEGIGIDAEFLDSLLTTSKIGLIGQLMKAVNLGIEQAPTNWALAVKPIMYIGLGLLLGYFIGGGSV